MCKKSGMKKTKTWKRVIEMSNITTINYFDPGKQTVLYKLYRKIIRKHFLGCYFELFDERHDDNANHLSNIKLFTL